MKFVKLWRSDLPVDEDLAKCIRKTSTGSIRWQQVSVPSPPNPAPRPLSLFSNSKSGTLSLALAGAGRRRPYGGGHWALGRLLIDCWNLRPPLFFLPDAGGCCSNQQEIWQGIWKDACPFNYSQLNGEQKNSVWMDFITRLQDNDGWHPFWGFTCMYLFKQSSPEEKARMREEFVRREMLEAANNPQDYGDDTPAEKREVDSDDEDGIENLANEILSLLYQGIWKPINGDHAYCPFCNRKVNPDFLSVLQHTESYRPEPPNAGGKKGTHRGLKCFLRANVPPHLEAMMTARTEKLGMWYEP